VQKVDLLHSGNDRRKAAVYDDKNSDSMPVLISETNIVIEPLMLDISIPAGIDGSFLRLSTSKTSKNGEHSG